MEEIGHVHATIEHCEFALMASQSPEIAGNLEGCWDAFIASDRDWNEYVANIVEYQLPRRFRGGVCR